ncbi:MAG: hypothetical protein COC19_07225 [SAR86 cluster bacterium]|uniref:PKD domain-containing protein n=1 Tax=SAR86 cluster bacterium TaxID=2030880 RepID=A0A2A4MI82_9GAMM|nr:MAG: hypothetical protein COC19_07225 [SAR86 cluster bacterium]
MLEPHRFFRAHTSASLLRKRLALFLIAGLAMPQMSFAASAISGGSPLFGCGPITVNFTDSSTVALPDTITGWNWTFGDGATSNQQHPSHTYQSPGAYDVSLTASSALAAALGTDINLGYVLVIGPDVDFSSAPTAGSSPLTVNFSDQTIIGAPITDWAWAFGDGGSSTSQHPEHIYTIAGSYQVSLTITDIDGCTRTVSKPTFITVSAGAPDNLAVTSGAGQSTINSTTFTNTLIATIIDANANPVPGESVTFTAPAAGASGSFASTGTSTEVVATNASGQAISSLFTANATAGSYSVIASFGALADINFTLTNTAPIPANLIASSGGGQGAEISTLFANALVATITDASGNLVPGESVTFTAPAAGASGSFASSATISETVVTDSSGQATSSAFTANATAGSYSVIASSGGLTDITFALKNYAPLPQVYIKSLMLSVGEQVSVSASGVDNESFLNTPSSAIFSVTAGDGTLDFRAHKSGQAQVIISMNDWVTIFNINVAMLNRVQQIPARVTTMSNGDVSSAVIHAGVSNDALFYSTEGVYSVGDTLHIFALIEAELKQIGKVASIIIALEDASDSGVFYLLKPDGTMALFDGSTLSYFSEVILEETTEINLFGEQGLALTESEVGRFHIYVGYQLEADGPLYYTDEAIIIEIID